MAIAYLNHTPIGKATQAQPYTAAAHMRYITRRSATNYIYSERMPVQYHAAQRFLSEREDTIRKNGRVCDKFIIALPREMTMEQGIDTLRDFGYRLSDGRAPFLFSIQDFNSDNPHAHFVYVDADVTDGKRVFKTTDRDSTDRIKKIWSETCNEHLLELGRTEQIAFGTANDDNAVELIGEVVQISEPLEVTKSVEQPAPENTLLQTDAKQTGDLPLPEEEEELDVSEPYVDFGAKERHERIKAAVAARRDRDFLKNERDKLARLGEAVTAAERAALDRHTDFNIASMDASLASLTAKVAQENVEYSPRGLHIKLPSFSFGLFSTPEVDWKSPARKEFTAAQAIKQAADYRASLAYAKAVDANTAAAVAAREAIDLEQKRQALADHLRTRGTSEELIEAEEILENTANRNISGISLEDVINEYEAGNITAEEAKDAHVLMGREDSWTLYEEMNGVDEGIEQ